MRAPLADLPVVLANATVVAGAVTILDRVSLTFAAGPPTVLIGPNGAGKTTLLRAAMGLTRLTQGEITWGGRADAPPTRRAILFQLPVMLRRSAAANIDYALGMTDVPRTQRIDELLALVGLQGLGRRPARRLSGGEQQRLARARSPATRPFFFSTSRPPVSIRRRPRRSRTSSARSPRAASKLSCRRTISVRPDGLAATSCCCIAVG